MTQVAAFAVVGAVLLACLPLLLFMVSRVLKRLDDLNTKVGQQNGRIGKLEAYREGDRSELVRLAQAVDAAR